MLVTWLNLVTFPRDHVYHKSLSALKVDNE